MSEFVLPLLVSLLVPGCGLGLLLWLDRLEETLDQSVQRRFATATGEPADPEQAQDPAPPAGQQSDAAGAASPGRAH